MPVIQVHDVQHPLKRGQTRLGSGPDADVRVSDDASLGVQAVLDLGADDQAIIRRAGGASAVKVNGVALGAEPTPLMHGDKVEIAGVELQYSEDRKAGATQYVSAAEIAEIAAAKRAGPARATAATGGRLVSLVDGKEYAIADTGITIGRDAGNDVVVAQSEVSRVHARLGPGETGYVLTDQSTNGVFVNGERVSGTKLLSRADVIRVGSEEFRFYADVAPIARSVAAPAAPTAPPPVAPTPAPPAPAPVASRPAPAPLSQEPTTLPTPAPTAAPAPVLRPVLAVLEMANEGPGKGQTFDVRASLTHVGRGPHNDIVLADESVSDSHAKLQLRDDGWYVVDAGSTNGTYVGGSRVEGERRLDGAPDLRFGGIKMRFRPVAQPSDAGKGTRRIATRPSDRASVAPAATKRGVPMWVWILLALVVVGGAVLYRLKG